MTRYFVNKLGKLIDAYLYNNSDTAKLEISNMIIDGEDLIESLGGVYSEIQEKIKEGLDYQDDLESIVSQLESTVGTKQGDFPDKIREIIKIYSHK